MILLTRKGDQSRVPILLVFFLLSFLVLVAFPAGFGVPAPSRAVAAEDITSPLVTAIDTQDLKDVVRLNLSTDRPAEFNLSRVYNPTRLVVDVPGAEVGSYTEPIEVGVSPVISIQPMTAERKFGDQEKTARFEILLESLVGYQVITSDTSVLIDFTKPEPGFAPVQVAQAGAEAPAGGEGPTTTISNVTVEKEGMGYLVTISGEGVFDFQTVKPDATTVVIDVLGAESQVWPAIIYPETPIVKTIRLSQVLEPEKKVRVFCELTSPVSYEVSSSGNQIFVHFGSRGGGTVEVAEEAMGEVIEEVPPVIQDLYFKPEPETWKIVITTNREVQTDVIPSDDPLVFMMAALGARLAPDTPQELDLTALNDVVESVRLDEMRDPQMVKITMKLAHASPYQVLQTGEYIYINVSKGLAGELALLPEGRGMITTLGPGAMVYEEDVQRQIESILGREKKVYTGDRITIDLKEAEIREVLRLISEVSGMNFVAGSDVVGAVTLKLTEVPWDQALDLILKTNEPALTAVEEAPNIMRIASSAKIEKESKEKQAEIDAILKEREKRRMLEPLVTKTFKISYAKAADLQGKVADFGSKDENAFITVDDRTNTLIVRDRKKNLADINAMITTLDQPEPAVKIEARIVEVRENYAKELGVQWGANYIADSGHGNAMDFAFPNSMSIGGGLTESGPSGKSLAVSLPIANPAGALGLTFGNIADTLSLDVRLQAMESLNQLKILSNPSILIVQNQPAKIHVGEQIPYYQTDAEGNQTVQFKDIGITLEVTPQITSDGSVFLDLSIKKDSRGQTVVVQGKEDVAIEAKEAITKVFLRDGETGVIGGLYTTEKSDTVTEVPGLSKLPIIGALFRSKAKSNKRTELLIFLTPRIIRGVKGESELTGG